MSKTMMARSLVSLCAVVLGVLAIQAAAEAGTINVSTVPQLTAALGTYGSPGSATAGDEVVITSGTYNLTSPLWMWNHGITVRSQSGNRDDVVLVGGGMNSNSGVRSILQVVGDNITIQDLTVSECFYNGIHLKGEYGGQANRGADGAVISNVKTLNIGERHIKGSAGGYITDDVLIENLYMLQTTPRLDTNPSGADYIGGIDVQNVRNWNVRDCVAQGIRGATGGGNAAFFLWHGVHGLTLERNVIFDCAKGIGLGLTSTPSAGTVSSPWHATESILRNNFVLRDNTDGGNKIALELCNTRDVKVYNNTLYSEDAGYFRTLSIYDANTGGATTNLQIVNNIIRGMAWENGAATPALQAAIEAMGNIVDNTGAVVVPTWFLDWANGDFHLTELAVAAIDAGATLADVPFDIDGDARPFGPAYDMGADELIPEPATLAMLAVGGCALIRRRRRAYRPSEPVAD